MPLTEHIRRDIGGREVIEASARSGPAASEDYSEFVGRIAKYAIQMRPDYDFRINAVRRSGDGFTLTRISTRAGNAQLSRDAIEIESDDHRGYALYLPLRGEQELSHLNRTVRCTPCNLTLVSMSAPLVQTKLGDNDTLYYFIPHEFVSQRMVWREEACAKPAHAEQGLWRLVRDALTGLARDEAHLTDAEFVGAARIVGDLVLLASDNLVDLQTTHSSVRAANLARAKRFIRAHCTNPNLTLTDVALACRLSLRYLHNLFRDDGRTMREVLQGERLRRAYDLLERQDPRSTTVTSIALASGFSNSSHFATAFRRAYSIMPKELLHRR